MRPWVAMTMLVTLAAAHEPPATLAAPPMAPAASHPHGMAWWDLTAKFGGARDANFGTRDISGSAYRQARRAPGSQQPWEAFQPLPKERRKARWQDAAVLSSTRGAPWGHPAPQGEDRRGGCPTAGLSPAPGTPPYLLWVRTSPGREGQDPAKKDAGGIEAASQHSSRRTRSEPQTCQEGEGLTGIPGKPGCPRGPGGPMLPCKDTGGGQGAARGIPQPYVLLQASPFHRWILHGKMRNSPQIFILVPPIPLHPALTCCPLGPGLPGMPWGPGLP